VGIGTGAAPTEKLEVAGNISALGLTTTGLTLNDGNQGPGKILQSNGVGNASWVEPPQTDDGDWVISGVIYTGTEEKLGLAQHRHLRIYI